MRLPRTAVLMGGLSREHEVSLSSGQAVLEALAHLGQEAVAVLLGRDGSWQVDRAPFCSPEEALAALRRLGIGCCFLAVHGGSGEDGTLQGFLETAGLPYTGSGVRASALAMSKTLTRAVLAAAGLPIAPGLSRQVGFLGKQLAQVCSSLRFPAFLKEEASGSSPGVYRIPDRGSLEPVLAGLDPGGWVVLEEAVPGLETSVGVLGNRGAGLERLEALPAVEIRPRRAFFDYEAKYRPELTEETCPPRELTPEQAASLQRLACQVHHLFGCDGASRTDFILGPSGPVILECNTLPGMTSASLLPLAARAAGMDFPELVRRLVVLALEAHVGKG